MKKLVESFDCNKIILATSTIVYLKDNKKLDKSWNRKIEERNEVVKLIVRENKYFLNDLYSVSKKIPIKLRYEDGTHYLPDGYEYFANEVVNCVSKIIYDY